MKAAVDRFEGHYAVVETEGGKMVNLPRDLVPPEAREGDVLSIEIDRAETERRREEARALAKSLRKR